jgi:hypothetical protein
MSGTWHVEDNVWAAYAAGGLDPVAVASVDAHVAGCAQCRGTARRYVPPPALEPVWTGISARVRRPELSWALRLLSRCRVQDDDLTLLGAAGGFSLPWAVAVGSALLTVVLAALVPSRQDLIFLLLSPLVPVLAVAAAFDATDPLRALTSATPYSKLRLVLLRTTATLAVAVPSTLAIGLGLPGLEAIAFAWLLPALALTLTALMAMTWLAPWPASAVVAAGWALAVWTADTAGTVGALSSSTTQLAMSTVAVLMSAALVLRSTTHRIAGGEG